MKWIRKTYLTLFSLSTILIIWYLVSLSLGGYINLCSSFNLETASKISPFLGSFIAPFISIASALLVLENLQAFKENNKENKENYSREFTLKQCQIFLTDTQKDTRELFSKFSSLNLSVLSTYLTEPLTNKQIVENPVMSEVKAVIENNHPDIVLFLNKLECLSAFFLHGAADLELGQRIIGKTFIPQVQIIIPFIAYYRSDETNLFCENIIELYKKWGGTIKPILEQIS